MNLKLCEISPGINDRITLVHCVETSHVGNDSKPLTFTTISIIGWHLKSISSLYEILRTRIDLSISSFNRGGCASIVVCVKLSERSLDWPPRGTPLVKRRSDPIRSANRWLSSEERSYFDTGKPTNWIDLEEIFRSIVRSCCSHSHRCVQSSRPYQHRSSHVSIGLQQYDQSNRTKSEEFENRSRRRRFVCPTIRPLFDHLDPSRAR